MLDVAIRQIASEETNPVKVERKIFIVTDDTKEHFPLIGSPRLREIKLQKGENIKSTFGTQLMYFSLRANKRHDK